VGAVCEFVEQYAKPSALRVFGDAALPLVERHAATLARYIQRHKLTRINASELKRAPHRLPGMTEAAPLNAAIEFLAEADWLKPIGQRHADNPGRKSSDFAVNPAVHGGGHGKMA
jgi:putative DNA primase/helicase